jgi:hypothetical protein
VTAGSGYYFLESFFVAENRKFTQNLHKNDVKKFRDASTKIFLLYNSDKGNGFIVWKFLRTPLDLPNVTLSSTHAIFVSQFLYTIIQAHFKKTVKVY